MKLSNQTITFFRTGILLKTNEIIPFEIKNIIVPITVKIIQLSVNGNAVNINPKILINNIDEKVIPEWNEIIFEFDRYLPKPVLNIKNNEDTIIMVNGSTLILINASLNNGMK